MADFYKEQVKKIELYIQQKKYNEALILVREELSMPYIPLEIESQLKKLLMEINSSIITSNPLGEDFLIKRVLNEKNIWEKISYLEIYLDSSKKNNNFLMDLLQKPDNELPFSVKARIINDLIKSKINKKIKINSKRINSINPMHFQELQFNKEFALTSKKIEELLYSFPTVKNFSLVLLETYFFSFFPSLPTLKVENLHLVISIIVANMLNDDKLAKTLTDSHNIDIIKMKSDIESISKFFQ